jgi:hypothetical protein
LFDTDRACVSSNETAIPARWVKQSICFTSHGPAYERLRKRLRGEERAGQFLVIHKHRLAHRVFDCHAPFRTEQEHLRKSPQEKGRPNGTALIDSRFRGESKMIGDQ